MPKKPPLLSFTSWRIFVRNFKSRIRTSSQCVIFLVSQDCIKPLCDLLICLDPRIVMVCLEGLENILKVGEPDKEMGMNGGINLYAQMIDECDGLDKIENLQTHDNHEI
ncbi:hypothetical protein ERO13_D03G015400v2 [Gossypium hirsutum]|uniref:Importin subunit alpha-4 n=4 Tax=Gossypium TaxID=3633 RepID=A0ABM2ZS70_GOSHI|nr:importin subunit alpha-4-like [Gossypium hirsutum]KAB2036641.1 hypothetical protein ES319_D03G015500v1 [Gossypium barbadense]KAG4153793.1 hypothetical protein ERO13_D03G015400v2 [Gossypium hirsutum]TYG75265.1 hypothetical protein ES288_D03G016100v1 [Gossypium darwinii]TYH78821.1 hypothetical protein ES332_D03G015700v1 [Gossypium tomentosum]